MKKRVSKNERKTAPNKQATATKQKISPQSHVESADEVLGARSTSGDDEKIARLSAEIDRLKQLAEIRSAVRQQAGAVSQACADYIKNIGLPIEAIPLHERAVSAAVPKGHTFHSAVEDRRRRLREPERARRAAMP